MKFYHIDLDYINYLKKFEHKVPNIEYEERHKKFFCGIVLNINDTSFYAPISSNKIKKATDYGIYNKDRILGTIRFAYMVPVPRDQVKVKDFACEDDQKYVGLLNKQLNFCKDKKSQIQKKAVWVYNKAIKKETKIASVCCDFKLLEEKCFEYDPSV